MVINEINETDWQLSRTIDTGTGVYLGVAGADLKDHIFRFAIKDGQTDICISTDMDYKLDRESKTKYIFYYVVGAMMSGLPNRKGYVELIRKLLTAHGYRFRSSERIFGYKEYVDVQISPRVEAGVAGWEFGNA